MSTDRAVHELRAQASPPLGAGRAGALALVLCVLAFAGAIAAGGVSSRVGSPPTGSFSVVELATLVVLGVLAALGLVALVWTRAWDDPTAAKRPPLWKRVLELVVLTAVVVGSLALIMMFVPKHPFASKPPPSHRVVRKAAPAQALRSPRPAPPRRSRFVATAPSKAPPARSRPGGVTRRPRRITAIN